MAALVVATMHGSALGGILDTPLPTFGDGKPAMLVASSTAVKNNNLETLVVCTNLADAPVDVGVEFLDETGAVRNTVAVGDGGVLALGVGASVTIASGTTAVMHEDAIVSFNTAGSTLSRLRHGSLRIVATDPRVGCGGYVLDRLHTIADPTTCAQCMPPIIMPLALVPGCSAATCDDGDPCTIDGCDAAGACTHSGAADGTACDDGNLCTTADVCRSGACAGTTVSCGPDTPCNVTMQCDPASGQCVAAPPRSSCIPGGGDAATDCVLEWVVENPGNPRGVSSATQVCRQGDGTCDFDTTAKRCTFRVRACLAAHDANLPSCVPSSVDTMTLLKPRPSAAIRPLLDAVAGLASSSRSGKGGKRVVFTPALATTDACTGPVAVAVKLGKATTLKTATVGAAGADKDRLRLQCVRKPRGSR